MTEEKAEQIAEALAKMINAFSHHGRYEYSEYAQGEAKRALVQALTEEEEKEGA